MRKESKQLPNSSLPNPPYETKDFPRIITNSQTTELWEVIFDSSLRELTTVEFEETPLQDAVRSLQQLSGINFVIDQRALDEAGIAVDTPVSFSVKQKDLESVLELLLNPLELDWTIQDEVLLIATARSLQRSLNVMVYREDVDVDADETIEAITQKIAPESWDEVGGPASIETLPSGVYIVRQSFRAHRQISKDFEKQLSPVALPAQSTKLALLAIVSRDKADAIVKSLNSLVQWDFTDISLNDVVEFASKNSSIEIDIDKEALKNAGLTLNMGVNISVDRISLRSALSLLLRRIDCAWYADKTGLHITTAEGLNNKMIVGKYDLAGQQKGDHRPLVEAIKSTIAPAQWDEVGGAGTIALQGETLVVKQSFAVHQELASLLEQLKRR